MEQQHPRPPFQERQTDLERVVVTGRRALRFIGFRGSPWEKNNWDPSRPPRGPWDKQPDPSDSAILDQLEERHGDEAGE